jgi:hypothetical protein
MAGVMIFVSLLGSNEMILINPSYRISVKSLCVLHQIILVAFMVLKILLQH